MMAQSSQRSLRRSQKIAFTLQGWALRVPRADADQLLSDFQGAQALRSTQESTSSTRPLWDPGSGCSSFVLADPRPRIGRCANRALSGVK
jgi:hypothetical protein